MSEMMSAATHAENAVHLLSRDTEGGPEAAKAEALLAVAAAIERLAKAVEASNGR